jgi:hypothetical protein
MGTRVKGYPALRRGLLPIPLVFEQLEVARSALERGEAARATTPPLDAAAAIERGGDRGRADEAAKQERPEAPSFAFAVHDLILEVAPGRAHGCSFWSDFIRLCAWLSARSAI